MKVSAKLCFFLLLPFFGLFVTKTSASLQHGKVVEKKEEELAPAKPIPETVEVNNSLREIKQKLDHFNPDDKQYFNQRYFVYKNGYVQGNPVFLAVGGFGEVEPPHYIEERIWNYFAKELGALLLVLEHRMYGQSYPRQWKNFSTENLVYLNTDQALADLAYFIDELTANNPEDIIIPSDAKWIALGSSHGGTLAARLKFKYPHIITGAVTFEAPLLPTVAFEGFYTNVEKQCNAKNVDSTIRNAFDEIKYNFNLRKRHEGGPLYRTWIEFQFSLLQKTFNFCNAGKLDNSYDIKYHRNFFFWSLTTILGQTLQFGIESENVIQILLDKNGTPNALDRLGEAVKLVLRNHNQECLIVDYKSLLDIYNDTSPEAKNNLEYTLYTGLGNRQILYQRCRELGQFETTRDFGIFSENIPIEFYMDLCKHVFESEFSVENLENAINKTNEFYGGRTMNVSNVLFVMSDDNFWLQLGHSGGKLWNKNTEDDSSNTILLKAEDHGDKISAWKYITKTLNNWLEVENIEENNVGTSGHVSIPIQNATVSCSN